MGETTQNIPKAYAKKKFQWEINFYEQLLSYWVRVRNTPTCGYQKQTNLKKNFPSRTISAKINHVHI